MEASPSQLEELRLQILAAFPQTNPPLRENITSHPCEECEDVTEQFSGVRWWRADDEIIDAYVEVLPLFTPEAYHYYLPAFLLRALAEFDPHGHVLQFCLYSLGSHRTEIDDWRRARMNGFTPEQAAVVGSLLEIVLQDKRFFHYHPEAELGLQQYWHV